MPSSSSEEEEEDSKRKHKKKKDFGKYLNSLCCTASKTSRTWNKKDGLCGMAHSSDIKRSKRHVWFEDRWMVAFWCDE
jgi:hypothetical protein